MLFDCLNEEQVIITMYETINLRWGFRRNELYKAVFYLVLEQRVHYSICCLVPFLAEYATILLFSTNDKVFQILLGGEGGFYDAL